MVCWCWSCWCVVGGVNDGIGTSVVGSVVLWVTVVMLWVIHMIMWAAAVLFLVL